MVKFDSSGKVTRIGFDPKMPEFFPLWAKAYGVDILSKDGLTPHLNDPRAVKALTYAMSLINAQGGWDKFKSFRDTWDFFGSKNQVAKDQVGAWPMEQWYYNVLAGVLAEGAHHRAAVPQPEGPADQLRDRLGVGDPEGRARTRPPPAPG